MRRIIIKGIRPPQFIPQSTDQKRKYRFNLSSFAQPLFATWAKVEEAHSSDNTVDLVLASGISLKRVGVRSLEWAGANADRGYGERDLPPKDSLVLVLFPDGVIENAFVLCSALSIVGTPSEKQKEELLADGKEREKIRITEAGWKETYDKGSGDYILESPASDTNQIKITVSRSEEKVEVDIGEKKLTVGSENKISANGATIEITSTGAINVTPATGQNIVLAGGTQNCNNFPNCIFSGAPHGTNLFVKV